MSPANAKRMNELARMTPEQRDESIVREMLGPLFDSFFGSTLPAYDRVLSEFDRKQEAENGICCDEDVCLEDREPPVLVGMFDPIPRPVDPYGCENPVSQKDED